MDSARKSCRTSNQTLPVGELGCWVGFASGSRGLSPATLRH